MLHYLLGIGFLLLIALAALLPGGMSEDSVEQLKQAREWGFKDSHPPMMAFIWRMVDSIYPGPAGMVVIHIMLIGLAVGILVWRFRLPLAVKLLAVAVTLFWPGYFFLLGVVWKDIAMLSALLLSLALVEVAPRRPAGLLAALGLIIYGVAVRHNAAPVAGPILAYALWMMWRTEKHVLLRIAGATVAGGIGVVMIFGANQVITSRLVSTKQHFWQVMAIFDLTGISVRTNQNLVPSEVFPLATMDEIALRYTPTSLVPLTQISKAFPKLYDGDEKLVTLRQAWIDAIWAHPVSYLLHRKEVTRNLLGLVPDEPWNSVYLAGVVPNPLGIPNREPEWSRQVKFYCYSLSHNGSWLYRPWVYLLALLFFVLVAFALRLRTGPFILVLGASALGNTAGLFFVAPAPDFRYSIWVVFGCVLAGAVGALNLAEVSLSEERLAAYRRAFEERKRLIRADVGRYLWVPVAKLSGAVAALGFVYIMFIRTEDAALFAKVIGNGSARGLESGDPHSFEVALRGVKDGNYVAMDTGGQVILIDLRKLFVAQQIEMALYDKINEPTDFSFEVSRDRKVWREVFNTATDASWTIREDLVAEIPLHETGRFRYIRFVFKAANGQNRLLLRRFTVRTKPKIFKVLANALGQ